MTTQSTIDKLIEMRLTSMSDAFLTQLQDARMKDLSFEDRFGMLVDIEYSNRKSNSLKRLIRNAGFDQPDAYIGDINLILSILVYTFFSRMFDLMLPPVAKHSIVVA